MVLPRTCSQYLAQCELPSGSNQTLKSDHMNRFKAIASSVCPQCVKSCDLQVCPDVYVSHAADLILPDNMGRRRPVSERPTQRAVLLILESPHKDEFKGVPSPAKGNTGRLIARHLHNVVGLENTADMPLILINAVQYQCSLKEKTTRHRDAVFEKCWDDFGRDDFIQRLRTIYRPGDTLVCSCTKGYFKDPTRHLRQRVWEAIQSMNLTVKTLPRSHPCSWYSSDRRKDEWRPV